MGVDVIEGWRPAEVGDLEVHVWDLGGQTIYQSVHSLFLSRRCMYLLVFEAGGAEGAQNTFCWV